MSRKRNRLVLAGPSKLSKACRCCPYVKTCDHKEMEAMAYLPDISVSMNYGEHLAAPTISQPMARETVKINVGGEIHTMYKDEFEKMIYESLYKNLYSGLREC